MAYQTFYRMWFVKYDTDEVEKDWKRDHVNSQSYVQFLDEMTAYANEHGARVVSVTVLEDTYRYNKGIHHSTTQPAGVQIAVIYERVV